MKADSGKRHSEKEAPPAREPSPARPDTPPTSYHRK